MFPPNWDGIGSPCNRRRRDLMYARVVRFTDIDRQRIDDMKGRIESGEDRPEGMPDATMRMFIDDSQNTAVVALFFESEEDMRKGDEALNAMDSSDTPGTRASVDQGEVLIETDL
jgi:hypothetical protein